MSLPEVFSPVCTTELSVCSTLVSEVKARGVKICVLVAGASLAELAEWSKDVRAAMENCKDDETHRDDRSSAAYDPGFPMIADELREIAGELGMLDPLEVEDGRPGVSRGLFLIGPDKTNRFCTLYPAKVGRHFAEVMRAVDSVLLTLDGLIATPANWLQGERLIVAPNVSTEEALRRFSNLEIKPLPSGKAYLRYVDCPAHAVPKTALLTSAVPGGGENGVSDFGLPPLGACFPDFTCVTTQGNFQFHDFLSRLPHWTVLFSHPKDFTPVCTTELGVCNSLVRELETQAVKLIGLSCDSVDDHREWSKDVLAARGNPGTELDFPLIGDPNRQIAARLGMLDPLEIGADSIPMPARALFVIGPDRSNRLTMLYPASSGRNFHELLRVLDALFLTQDSPLSTPANWEKGHRLVVSPQLPTASACSGNLEIKELPSGRDYLRYVPSSG